MIGTRLTQAGSGATCASEGLTKGDKMGFLTQYWEYIALGVGGVLAIAGVVVKMTKTKKDDEILGEVQSLWQKFVGLFGRNK